MTFIIGGCTTSGVIDNPPTKTINKEGYSWHSWAQGDHNNDLTLILSFSGGGTRAAALSYGVLKGLQDTSIPVNGHSVSILDEVDYISSVSGGSFTAAYYGLHGYKIFQDFEEAFLLRDVEQHLFWGLLNPLEWFRKGGRTEMAVKYYNDMVFHDATFSDMKKDGPLIIINASELGHGIRFSFIQEYFSLFCSDLSEFPVAKAVAASSAVPIVFLPVVLEKYTDCNQTKPEWLASVKEQSEDQPVLNETVTGMEFLLSQDKGDFLHLVDGGITDNLGLHAILDIVALAGGAQNTLRKLKKKAPKKLVVISVNSSTEPRPEMAYSKNEPSIGETISSMSDIQLHRYNNTTLQMMKRSLEKWAKEVSTPERQVESYFINIGLKDISEPKMRLIFNKIPTSFALSQETVDHLVSGGQKMLHKDPEYQRLLTDMNGTVFSKDK
ncbi:MAG: patatin-like phospholipase family protein [gamma proteobacterium symbiont of Lucinoma myriamae]|nr:patatin-like phospholipase family protein [gamma proteobacterium symbiont of Lucinoma myriamae]